MCRWDYLVELFFCWCFSSLGLIVCCVDSVMNFVGYDYQRERSLKGGTGVGDLESN